MEYPQTVLHDVSCRKLQILWQDGTLQQIEDDALRAACRCAECVSLRAPRPDIAPFVSIEEIEFVGAYALRFLFSDGHARGIYPFPYLRSLSPSRQTAPPPSAEFRHRSIP
jgi:DUF971 family protein